MLSWKIILELRHERNSICSDCTPCGPCGWVEILARSVHVKQRPGLMDGILSLVLPPEVGTAWDRWNSYGQMQFEIELCMCIDITTWLRVWKLAQGALPPEVGTAWGQMEQLWTNAIWDRALYVHWHNRLDSGFESCSRGTQPATVQTGGIAGSPRWCCEGWGPMIIPI